VLDNTAFEMQRAWPLFRRFFLAIGERLHQQGKLEAASDVFFLGYGELVGASRNASSGSNLARMAQENRKAWQAQHELHPPRCIPPPGDAAWERAVKWPINMRALCGEETPQDWILRGIAASPGRRTGRARVCLTLEEAAGLQAGEILVTPRTTPNWTPLFSQVAAIVTDVGAATSHSSVIAREFRIPAVVGTQQATQVVKSGDQVTVDGTAGLVHLQLQTL
jgi:pyruvate,water dikinase